MTGTAAVRPDRPIPARPRPECRPPPCAVPSSSSSPSRWPRSPRRRPLPAQTSSATPFPGGRSTSASAGSGTSTSPATGRAPSSTSSPTAACDHVFATRLVGGAFTAPERLDVDLPAPAAQPVVAATDGGRLVAVFTAGGAVLATVRPGPRRPWTAPQVLATAGSDPSVDLSINGVAYASFTAPGAGGADVRVARLEHDGTAFTVLDAPVDLDPAAAAGTGTGARA